MSSPIIRIFILLLVFFVGHSLAIAVYNFPVSVQTAELAMFAQGIDLPPSGDLAHFGLENGYFLFWLPTLFLQLFSKFLPLTPVTLQILGLLCAARAIYFASLLDSKRRIAFPLVLATIPWFYFISLFDVRAALSLLFGLAGAYYVRKKNLRSFPALLALGFTNWPGFITATTGSIVLGFNHGKRFFTVTLVLILALFLNRGYVIHTYNSTFISKLAPGQLAQNINERQKTDFLATGQTYLLPGLARKFIYNKPSLALNNTVKHSIALMDFEAAASPLESYEITRLSGFSPVNNPRLLLKWQVVVGFLGFLALLSSRNLRNGLILAVPFLGYFVFETHSLATSGYLLVPAIALGVATGTEYIKAIFPRPIFIFTIFVFALSLGAYFKDFYQYQSRYHRNDIYLYRLLAEEVEALGNRNMKMTLLGGPNDLMVAYYTGYDARDFWEQRFGSEGVLGNVRFATIEEHDKGLLIGFIGEFVGKGMKLDERPVPSDIKIIKRIPLEQELVFNYGREIWIAER